MHAQYHERYNYYFFCKAKIESKNNHLVLKIAWDANSDELRYKIQELLLY